MKRICLLCVAVMMATCPMLAKDNNVLRHLSLSVGVGTTGVTADLGTMVTNTFGLRGGVDYMPEIKGNTWFDLSYIGQNIPESADADVYQQMLNRMPHSVQVEGKFKSFTGHALLDIYPLSDRGFRFTVGAYFGGSEDKIVTVCNTQDGVLKEVADFNARRDVYALIPAEYGQIAAKLGEYNLMPDNNGNANGYIQVKNVRPYLGVGFGRAVPNSRINCQFDAGVQFWGTPKVFNGVNGQQLTADGAMGDDGGLIKIVSDIKVFPVLTFRLCGRIF